jgi:oxygen-independent coproporphyrinogen-3 oxidase
LESSPGQPGFRPVRSLYVHVPFCFHKCHYCDFYSIVDSRDRQGPFVARLERELAALAPWSGGLPLETLFVGGGTPSLLRIDLWEQLLCSLGSSFDLSLMRSGAGEFTVECNPETVTPPLMDTLARGSVNRVSIGAQSFKNSHLKTLERWHDPANVSAAVAMARDAGISRQSIDLIFAIPGQTLDDWRRDLDTALSLGTTHLSCYNLTYEPATALTARLQRGEFQRTDEDLEADMYEATLAMVRTAGLDRYEVSNYSKPGHESRHNLAYWRQEEWLAAGPSASAHVGGHRWKNAARLDDYLNVDDRGFAPIVDHEAPDPKRGLVERIMTGLRIREGLDIQSACAEAYALLGAGVAERLQSLAATYRRSGHLVDDPMRWRPTDSGFLIADTIAGDFIGVLDR